MGEMTVQYLYRVSDLIDDNGSSARSIIRNLREKCKESKDDYGHYFRLPLSLFGRSALCPLCLTPWTSGRYKLRMCSNGTNKKRKRCLSKLFSMPADHRNKFQSSLIKRLSSQGNNFMRLTCCECNKVTKIGFKKSSLVSDDKSSIEGSTVDNIQAVKKAKKKKKKKDLLCGLKASAVAQVQTTSKRNIKVSHNESVENMQTSTDFNDTNNSKLNKSNTVNNTPEISDSRVVKINQSLKESTIRVNTTDSMKLKHQHNNSFTERNESGSKDVIRKRNINSLMSKVPSNEVKSDIHVKKSKSDHVRENNNLSENLDNSLKKIKGNETKNIKFRGGVDDAMISKSPKDSNKQSGSINNLLSQPSLNIIQNQNNKHFNKSNNQVTQKTDSFNRQTTITKNNKKINNNNSNNTSNSNCSLTNNLQQVNSSNKGKKKKSKKHKLKGTKIIHDNYKVFEKSNCKNSLCINDLLHLT